MKYDIKGMRLVEYHLDDPKFRYVKYKGFLFIISIATDSMGTQICHNGQFFGRMDFPSLEVAVDYLRDNRINAIKFFRKVYLHSLNYKFSGRHFDYLLWQIVNYFYPDFYLLNKRNVISQILYNLKVIS